ncbi:MAG: c-type cytochrome [Rhodocyclaceae bacterium]|nr:c-type cytochrome [Rhodocyclaceae bacterium]
MKRIAFALLGVAAALPAGAAPQGDAPTTPYFVANCFNCHGTEGKGNTAIPSLAGRDRAFLEESLKVYKAGGKPATIMHQLAKGYTDEEIAVLADYFSRQK